MNTRSITLIFFLGFLGNVLAQNDKQARINELLEKRTAYICSKIGLTPQEKAKFIPLYNEFQQKRMALSQKTRSRNDGNKSSFTEEDYKELNETSINGKLYRAQLERTYYEKLREVLPESKIFALFQAERQYRQELMKKIRNQKNLKKVAANK